jgi:hypothetical protein
MALTTEDFEIWLRLNHGGDWGLHSLYCASLESDRRDAQLMADAQHHPRCISHWAIWRLSAVQVRGMRS